MAKEKNKRPNGVVKPPDFTIAELQRNPNVDGFNKACSYIDRKIKQSWQNHLDHNLLTIEDDLLHVHFADEFPLYLLYPPNARWLDLLKGFKRSLRERLSYLRRGRKDWRTMAYICIGDHYVQVRFDRKGEPALPISSKSRQKEKGAFSLNEERDTIAGSTADEKLCQSMTKSKIRRVVVTKLNEEEQLLAREYLMKPKPERPSQAQLAEMLEKTQSAVNQSIAKLVKKLEKLLKNH